MVKKTRMLLFASLAVVVLAAYSRESRSLASSLKLRFEVTRSLDVLQTPPVGPMMLKKNQISRVTVTSTSTPTFHPTGTSTPLSPTPTALLPTATRPSTTAIPTQAQTDTPPPPPTATPGPPSPTATATQIFPTANPTNTPSPDQTDTPLPPAATATMTITPPVTVTNWLVNGRFDIADADPQTGKGSIEGWTQLNGYWWDGVNTGLHHSLSCSPSGTWYLQMDRDENGKDLWPPPPSEDWIYQNVSAPYPHDVLFLHYEEAHHMKTGIIQLTIYGRHAGGEWEIVYRQTGLQSPYGTGKCNTFGSPVTYDVEIPVEPGGYDEYRLEVYGKMLDPGNAVLWGDFRLTGGVSGMK
jgi:hypothetical protein